MPMERTTLLSNPVMWSLKLKSLSMITPKYLALLTTFSGDPLLVILRRGSCALVCLRGIIAMFVLVGLPNNLITLHQK